MSRHLYLSRWPHPRRYRSTYSVTLWQRLPDSWRHVIEVLATVLLTLAGVAVGGW